ncbi:hypothetical protein DB30_01747 [Enhygromyxa salina]|uniref:Peptidase S1 domain-containing protein n=1 Tax=Enhygromyxa salina TaxID=215803 RepID=A0A0C2CM13_9BACT|nr:hypothetical protein DB30_01747 [Enhygromyxa salina]
MVRDRDGVAGIITAKHNLWMNERSRNDKFPEPATWDDAKANEMVENFLIDLHVGYNATLGGLPASTEPLDPNKGDIEFRSDGNDDWSYDLMFIAFKEDLSIRDWMNDRRSPAGIDYDTRKDRSVNDHFYARQMLGRQVFITGFGDQLNHAGRGTGGLSNSLQVRAANVAANATTALRMEPSEVYEQVLPINASDNSSTAPGDSGGPVFTIDNRRLLLVGATLGANFAARRLMGGSPIVNNAATFIVRQGRLF